VADRPVHYEPPHPHAGGKDCKPGNAAAVMRMKRGFVAASRKRKPSFSAGEKAKRLLFLRFFSEFVWG
jgi:hypothetical protein